MPGGRSSFLNSMAIEQRDKTALRILTDHRPNSKTQNVEASPLHETQRRVVLRTGTAKDEARCLQPVGTNTGLAFIRTSSRTAERCPNGRRCALQTKYSRARKARGHGSCGACSEFGNEPCRGSQERTACPRRPSSPIQSQLNCRRNRAAVDRLVPRLIAPHPST